MWLYVPPQNPCASSRSAPAEAGSISASSWPFRVLEASVWWRGKPSRSRHWWRRWNERSWLRLLCGRMSEPSTVDAGVAAWMASSAGYLASRIPSPASGSAPTTSATCGARRGGSSCSPAPGSSSSRTSPACSPAAAPSGSGETFAAWASQLREESSRRRNWVEAMRGSGCSSSAWPTAPVDSATDRAERYAQGGLPLSLAAAWPTPAARDIKGANSTSHMARSTGAKHLCQLPNFVAHVWATPTIKGNHNRAGISPKAGDGLVTQALRDWSTPSVADVTGGRKSRSGERSSELLINGQSEALMTGLSTPRDRATSPDGAPCSSDGPTSPRRLNPMFVEWLMGWPEGWTRLALETSTSSEPMPCGFSETAFIRWRRHMHAELSRLISIAEACPRQMSLFG